MLKAIKDKNYKKWHQEIQIGDYMQEKTANIITALKQKYKNDPEALELTENTIKDIEYIENKEAAGGYEGQPSISKAQELEAFLHDWY